MVNPTDSSPRPPYMHRLGEGSTRRRSLDHTAFVSGSSSKANDHRSWNKFSFRDVKVTFNAVSFSNSSTETDEDEASEDSREEGAGVFSHAGASQLGSEASIDESEEEEEELKKDAGGSSSTTNSKAERVEETLTQMKYQRCWYIVAASVGVLILAITALFLVTGLLQSHHLISLPQGLAHVVTVGNTPHLWTVSIGGITLGTGLCGVAVYKICRICVEGRALESEQPH